jgi:hypothetical protein
LTTLPPSVPRFWICAAPMVAAASARAGYELGHLGGAPQVGVGRQGADDERIGIHVDAAQLVQPPDVEHPARGLADLAGDGDHEVGAAGKGTPRAAIRVGQQGIRLLESRG